MNTAIVVFLICALFGIAIMLLSAEHFRRHDSAMCRHFVEFEGERPAVRYLRSVD